MSYTGVTGIPGEMTIGKELFMCIYHNHIDVRLIVLVV